ncbi:MAG: hypothetical protein GWN00_14820, partial [Aliifodinibius sp.]|nr:hypothetical protein [Fodinibius sp.]NIY26031.1 hypothetical protein [Fodinibius sp.]
DDYGTCGSIIDPSPVAEAITIPITTPSALLAIQVDYNTTYYIRVRVCYKTEFNCSSWSTERILTIGDSIPDNPTFLNIF